MEKRRQQRTTSSGKSWSSMMSLRIPKKLVSQPLNVIHKVHIDSEYNWSGHDTEGFELLEKLGEG